MTYSRENVNAFVQMLMTQERQFVLEFLMRLVGPISYDNAERLHRLIRQFEGLSSWEKCNVLYKLAPWAKGAVTGMAKDHAQKARKEHMEQETDEVRKDGKLCEIK